MKTYCESPSTDDLVQQKHLYTYLCVGSIWPDTGESKMNLARTCCLCSMMEHSMYITEQIIIITPAGLLPFPWKQGLDFRQCPHNPHSSELSDFSSYCNTYVEHTQLCLALCDRVDYSPPDPSVDGIFPGKNTGVGCHFLLQGIFLTQGSNPCLLRWQAVSLPLNHLGSPTATLSNGHCLKQCLSTCTSFRDDSCIVLDEDSGSRRESWRTEC